MSILTTTRRRVVKSIWVNEHEIKAGDGLKIKDEPALLLAHGHEAEVLLFELP